MGGRLRVRECDRFCRVSEAGNAGRVREPGSLQLAFPCAFPEPPQPQLGAVKEPGHRGRLLRDERQADGEDGNSRARHGHEEDSHQGERDTRANESATLPSAALVPALAAVAVLEATPGRTVYEAVPAGHVQHAPVSAKTAPNAPNGAFRARALRPIVSLT